MRFGPTIGIIVLPEAILYTGASARVVPFQDLTAANQETGAALQAAIDAENDGTFRVFAVKPGRTYYYGFYEAGSASRPGLMRIWGILVGDEHV